ncbi:uncharacterized protein LOC110664753 isoform X2 [Hevea brasiliensis]|uniref:uncharacterized protein LOC110664753 isoform X2 n=1 Tax=Hevea brasiliensis TaxID=3981 RepID=UPI0025D421BD|nr:uncharacterized protein LOC110664753 isoform X2 [Hevea brasiliensis]
MILWFVKDRKFSVEDVKWRQEFGVSKLTEESVKSVADTGKAYAHDFLDIFDRPVLVVVPSKDFPGVHDPIENEKLCVFLVEKALAKLNSGHIFCLSSFITDDTALTNVMLAQSVYWHVVLTIITSS